MREILFRAQTINKEWIYGLLAHKYDRWYISNKAGMPFAYDVRPETICQYTGLTDKNGVKIWEGDIIKTHYANALKCDFIEKVIFFNGRFCSLFLSKDTGKMISGIADGVRHLIQDKSIYMEWCEVIGNRFDNPELLKGDTE